MVRAAPIDHVSHTSFSPALIYHSSLTGKCAANSLTEMNLDAPKDLLNLDVMHKRSTGKNVEAMTHGRFGTAPRGTRRNACAATHTTSFSPHLTPRLLCACACAAFFGDTAVARSNSSVPARLFLDPYHVGEGNLWAENFLMGRYQRGGQTCLAGRSSMMKMEKERFGKDDMQSRARSKYLEPEGGRFVPPLKPACSRDKGPDPYGTFKHAKWVIPNTGYAGGMGSKSKTAPSWSTFALSRPSVSQ